MRLFSYVFLLSSSFAFSAYAAPSPWLMEQTSTELDKAQKNNSLKRVVIPTAGIEQNGPALAIGKHHYIIEYTAERVASALPGTLLAPILDYVPEGKINPPSGHMQTIGTISLRPETFAAVLEDTARSLKQHRFTHIYFMGDHGDSQALQNQVAEKLSAEWKNEKILVANLDNYYAHNWRNEAVRKMGVEEAELTAHMGLLDSAELLAANKAMTRDNDALHPKATKSLGEKMLKLKADAAIEQIEEWESRQ